MARYTGSARGRRGRLACTRYADVEGDPRPGGPGAGIGRLTYEAVIYRDFPLLQAVIILKSILILSINLGVDILYAYVDPRIRLA